MTTLAVRTACDDLADDVANVDLAIVGPFFHNPATNQVAVGIEGGGYYVADVPWQDDAEYTAHLPIGFVQLPPPPPGDEPCPGCGCRPGDGVTDGCDHPDGCGFDQGGDR